MFGKLAPVFAFLAFSLQPALGVAVVPRAAQDVFVPPVLTPTTGTVWTVGQTQNITWYVVFDRSVIVRLRNRELTVLAPLFLFPSQGRLEPPQGHHQRRDFDPSPEGWFDYPRYARVCSRCLSASLIPYHSYPREGLRHPPRKH